MIKKGTTSIAEIKKGTTTIGSVYKGYDLVFESWKTLTTQGIPPITINKCKNANMLGYKVYGQSTQQTYTGKNLWNSTLIAGCMKFADGQYLNYPGYVCNATPISVEAGQTYTISANNYNDPEQTSTGFVFYNNGTFVSSLITTSLTVTIPSGVNQLYYDFRKQSSASSLSPSDITNVQLEKGSSATSYEPYVGGIKAPNPYYPQEIESVGDKTKNLFDLSSADFRPNNDLITISKTSNSVILTNTSQWSGEYVYFENFLKPNTTYTATMKLTKTVNQSDGQSAGSMEYCWWLQTNTTFDTGTKVRVLGNEYSAGISTVTFTTPSDMTNYKYIVTRLSGYCTYTFENIQIEEGETATTYEPYGYKIPIKVSGKNLITYPYSVSSQTLNGVTLTAQSDGSITLNGLCSASANFVLGTISVPQGKFTFSSNANKIPSSDGNACIQLYSYGTGQSFYIANETATTPVTQTVSGGNFEFRVRIQTGVNYEGVVYKPQLEKGDTATAYEPYVAPRKTNIYLDEPLRKIGSGIPQKLPSGYTQLEYIESTGTQYIDTQVAPNSTQFGVDIRFKFVNPSSAQAICGSANNGTPYLWNAIAYSSTYSDLYTQYSKNGSSTTARGIIGSGIDSASYNIKNTTIIGNVNSNTFSDTCNSYSSNSHSIYLFARNDYGSASLKANARIYSCKITSNDTLVRNLIPAKNSSNVVGLYDLVNDVFYTNAGTGTFTAGSAIYADYIDLETQKVYRNVGHIDLGSLTWSYQSNLSRFRSSAIDNIKIVPSNWTYDLMCDMYGTTLARNFNIGVQNTIGFVWDDRFTDADDLADDVKGHYLDYATATTVEETITLPDILLNKGTNIIEADTDTTPSNVWIKYKGKQ